MLKSKKPLEAVKWLDQNEVIAIPTETVYGLAANIHSKEAIKKIYTIKNRPLNNPLIVHIKSEHELSKYAQNIPLKARILAKTFWPGALTLLLKKSSINSRLYYRKQRNGCTKSSRSSVNASIVAAVGIPYCGSKCKSVKLCERNRSISCGFLF